VVADCLRHLADSGALGGNHPQDGRHPPFVFVQFLMLGRVLAAGIRHFFRARQLQHCPQGALGMLHAGFVRLVDHQYIGNLQDAGFNCLDVIAHAGRFHHDGGMRQPGNIHLRLPGADCLDQHQVKPGSIQHLHHGSRAGRQPAQRPA